MLSRMAILSIFDLMFRGYDEWPNGGLQKAMGFRVSFENGKKCPVETERETFFTDFK